VLRRPVELATVCCLSAHSFICCLNDRLSAEAALRSAAKIGRLGVAEKIQRDGYGKKVLDYLKMSFTTGIKTGCRFLIIDAYNNEKLTNFYHKNGFRYLTGEHVGDTTRIMYFDLIRFIR